MAKRNLTTQSMLTVSECWIDPAQEKPILQRYPLTSGMIPYIIRAHTNLVAFQRASSESQNELAAVQKEQAALDAVHDRKMRGVYGALTSLGELAENADKARHYLDLRDRVLPEGLRETTRSYVDQAGEISRLRGRLDDATKLALEAIPTAEGPLYLHVLAWMKAATALNELEKKRLDIARTASDDTRKSDVLRARFDWMRMVDGLRANLQLDAASAEDTYRIFRHLDLAEAKADRRAAGLPVPAKGEGEPPVATEEPMPCAEMSPLGDGDR